MFRAGTERRPQRAPQGFKPRYAVVQPESSTPHRRWAVPGARGRACALLPLARSLGRHGCSRENAGERLTRECREVVDSEADSENTTNPDVATVKRADMEAVIRSARRCKP